MPAKDCQHQSYECIEATQQQAWIFICHRAGDKPVADNKKTKAYENFKDKVYYVDDDRILYVKYIVPFKDLSKL